MIGHGYTVVRFLVLYCSDKILEGAGSGKDEEMPVYGFISTMTLPLQIVVLVPVDWVGRNKRNRFF